MNPRGGNLTTRAWEQDPPEVDSMWVQKLATPLPNGNNLIMRIKYVADPTLTTTLSIYHGDAAYNTFHDDGIAPDLVANDYNYAAYITEDIPKFVTQVTTLNANLQAAGTITTFSGHDAIEITNPHLFELAAFNNGIETIVPPKITAGFNCSSAGLVRERSLFITSLDVTEDLSRTYNVRDNTGNATGVWTFGQMIKNMANESVSGVSAKTFLKEWLKNWLTDQTINGQTVRSRLDARTFLIYPWVIKVDPTLLGVIPTTSNPANDIKLAADYLFDHPNYWETVWDNTNSTEASILKNAPFKLSAIVNRIDLRGNSGYRLGMNNTGETRFIFSLIAPVTGDFKNQIGGTAFVHGGELVAGTVPHPKFIGNPTEIEQGADWKGMNVIFEYQNVQTTNCAAQTFAQQWADLSTYTTMGSNTAYNQALENITNQVTNANAAPGKPNGSAIGRVRTNERIFSVSGQDDYNVPKPGASASWDNSNWELRQFEIDPNSHKLELVPVQNTPVSSANYIYPASAVSEVVQSITDDRPSLTFDGIHNPDALVYNQAQCEKLLDWAFDPLNAGAILREIHSVPKDFPGTTTPLLAGSAILQMDYVHTLNFRWFANTQNHPYQPGTSVTYLANGDYPRDRMIRHKLAINTCQGCHSGETKTIFTQVRPIGYGESADYSGAIPTYESDVTPGSVMQLDTRFTANTGNTSVNIGTGGVLNYVSQPNYDKAKATSNRYFQRVSAFITGRSYTGPIGSPTFDDDNPDPADNLYDADPSLKGTFWVNDPINMINTVPFPPHTLLTKANDNVRQHGFNELLRRKNDMCLFLGENCNQSIIMQIAAAISLNPLTE